MGLVDIWKDGDIVQVQESDLHRSDLAFEFEMTRQYSFIEFMDLFTEQEQLAIAGAAMTDVTVKLWYDRAVGAAYILLTDPRTIVGVGELVSAGLITPERRDAVLSGQTPQEGA